MNVPTLLRRAALPVLLLTSACQLPEELPPPPGLLPKAQMATLLIKQHLLEARIESSRLSPDSARALFLSQQRTLFQQQHLSAKDSAFERSYRYYAAHDKDLDDIYTVVVDSLQAIQRRLGGTDLQAQHH